MFYKQLLLGKTQFQTMVYRNIQKLFRKSLKPEYITIYQARRTDQNGEIAFYDKVFNEALATHEDKCKSANIKQSPKSEI